MPAKDPVLTPELIKILKIFGLGSILLVFALSFFDTYRSSNSGKDLTFRVSDSARLYFLNLKAIKYDREIRQDAGMTLYRHRGFSEQDSVPGLHLIIIINPNNDEGYIYLDPINLEFPFSIKLAENDSSTVEMVNGNKVDHFDQLQAILPWIKSEAKLELVVKDQKIPLWQSESEKEALKVTLEDYFRLLED